MYVARGIKWNTGMESNLSFETDNVILHFEDTTYVSLTYSALFLVRECVS